MKTKELRKKNDEELMKMLAELAKERISSNESPKKRASIKKVVARIKTILRERGVKI